MSHQTRCLNNLGQNMQYVVQAFNVLKNLVHAKANARAQKTGFFVAFLTQTIDIYLSGLLAVILFD